MQDHGVTPHAMLKGCRGVLMSRKALRRFSAESLELWGQLKLTMIVEVVFSPTLWAVSITCMMTNMCHLSENQ